MKSTPRRKQAEARPNRTGVWGRPETGKKSILTHTVTEALSNTKAVLLRLFLPQQDTKLLKMQNPATLRLLWALHSHWVAVGPENTACCLAAQQPPERPLSPHSCFHNLAHYRWISMLHAKPAFYIMPPRPSCTTWKTGMLRGTSIRLAHTPLPLLLEVRTALLYCEPGSILSQWRAKQPGVLGRL